jgi:hypothetical protein
MLIVSPAHNNELVCSGLRHCVDLAAALRAVPAGEIDLGPDGGHYGRRANAIIAGVVLDSLPRGAPARPAT